MDRLLERDSALDELHDALSDATRGQGRLVLIMGEAGIGKTSVVRAFLAGLAGNRAVRILRGACDDLVTPRELGPFHDLAPGARAELRTALAAGDMQDFFEALLAEIASPVSVLVVEDVHWADDATIDALAFLARRVEHHPALILVTYRDDEVPPGSPLLRLLGRVRRPAGRRIVLAPLSARAVSALAGQLGAGVRLHAWTGGNPFFVTELLAAQDEGLPASVRDAVLARVGTLPEASRALLDLLAVMPTRLETPLLDALHPGWAGDVVPAERRGIVEVRDGALAFRHELARLAVVNGMPALQRHAAGRSVLAALLRQDPLDEARVLHHAVLCQDATAIATHGPAAARRATRAGAHRQALAHYEQLRPHEDLLDPAERAAVAEEHAWELYNALRFADAVRLSRHAVDLRRDLGEKSALGRAMVTLAWHLYLDAEVAEARSAVDDAVALLEPAGDPRALALARSYRGFLNVLSDREEEGLAELADLADLLGTRPGIRSTRRGRSTEGSAWLSSATRPAWSSCSAVSPTRRLEGSASSPRSATPRWSRRRAGSDATRTCAASPTPVSPGPARPTCGRTASPSRRTCTSCASRRAVGTTRRRGCGTCCGPRPKRASSVGRRCRTWGGSCCGADIPRRTSCSTAPGSWACVPTSCRCSCPPGSR